MTTEEKLNILNTTPPTVFNRKYEHGIMFEVDGRMKGRSDGICWSIHPATMDGIYTNKKTKQVVSCVLSAHSRSTHAYADDKWFNRYTQKWMSHTGDQMSGCMNDNPEFTPVGNEEIVYVGVLSKADAKKNKNHVMLHSHCDIRMNVYYTDHTEDGKKIKEKKVYMHTLGYYKITRHRYKTVVTEKGSITIPVFFMERS